MDDIAPIETTYNGLTFRSRLEARWAVFFDKLGVRYEYAKQSFHFTVFDAERTELRPTGYIPDFWLPDLALWVEIKPWSMQGFGEAAGKARGLAIETKQPVLLTLGSPQPNAFQDKAYQAVLFRPVERWPLFARNFRDLAGYAIFNLRWCECSHCGSVMPCPEERLPFRSGDCTFELDTPRVLVACKAAANKRFGV